MLKVFVQTEDHMNILNISTIQQGETYVEVYMTEPILYLDRLPGYRMEFGTDGTTRTFLTYDENKYAEHIKNKQKEEAMAAGEALMDSLSEKAVLKLATDEEAYIMRYMYPEYEVGITYSKGDRFVWQDKFYKVIASAPFKSTEEWTPDAAPSLYVEISDPNVEYPEFKQPINAETSYAKGDKITYKNERYISKIDNNAYSPEAYPAGWEKVKE